MNISLHIPYTKRSLPLSLSLSLSHSLFSGTTTVSEQPRSTPSTIITTPLLVMSSTRTTIAASIMPSIGGVGTCKYYCAWLQNVFND